MIEPSAERSDAAVVVMLAIATGKGIEIAIDAFGSQRIANEATKS